MPFLILSIFIQVAFVVHILKTGRNTYWIWLVIMLPMAGSIAYLIVEILPGITNSRAGRQAGRKVQTVLNPNKDFNEAARKYTISDTAENTMRLAEECFNKGLFNDANSLYKKCLIGAHADDPHLMFGLAKTEFELGNFQDVKSILDKLIELNPDYKNQDAHLQYARALEHLNKVEAALHEYETLYDYYVGPDAAYYYAKFLQKYGQKDKAINIYKNIIDKAKQSNKHYNSLHQNIIKMAKKSLQEQ